VKANPKFHHWQTDDKRFGLTFERYDDAKAFDKGIRSAVADLVDGMLRLGKIKMTLQGIDFIGCKFHSFSYPDKIVWS
jgi:uncharacterized membrane protein YbaN (DUF454 family)